jgi:hypothetical protein
LVANTGTGIRGFNGSTAAVHENGDIVYIFRPLENIRLATILYALWRYRQSASNEEGSAAILDSGETVKVSPKIPQNILDLLPAPKPKRLR